MATGDRNCVASSQGWVFFDRGLLDAAIALEHATGLAASGKIRMDTIFIDEGFGSLDTENGAGTLDQVIQVLAALTEGSRAVGLISHVGLVQEAIPQGFYVRSTPSGSRVEERTGMG